jgi:hypothetical protein
VAFFYSVYFIAQGVDKYIVCAGNDESDQQAEQIEHLSIALAAGVFAVRQT